MSTEQEEKEPREQGEQSSWSFALELIFNGLEAIAWLVAGCVRLVAWLLAAVASSCR